MRRIPQERRIRVKPDAEGSRTAFRGGCGSGGPKTWPSKADGGHGLFSRTALARRPSRGQARGEHGCPSHQKKRLNRSSNARLSLSPHNVERRRMASAAGEPLRQSHTTERDNECDDAPRRRAAPFGGHDPHGRWPGCCLYRTGTGRRREDHHRSGARDCAESPSRPKSRTKNSNARMAEADFATRSASIPVRALKNSAWTPQRAKCSRTVPTEKSSIRRSRPPRRERRFPY